jgi:hypothetical protein
MECFGTLLILLVFLLAAAAVFGPLIWLLEKGNKMLEDWNLSVHVRRDFFIGFFGIIILNAILYSLSLALTGGNTSQGIRATICLALPWVVNLALLLFFAFYRSWIAKGALALIGFLLAWSFLAGVFFFAGCLVLGGVASLFTSCLGY